MSPNPLSALMGDHSVKNEGPRALRVTDANGRVLIVPPGSEYVGTLKRIWFGDGPAKFTVLPISEKATQP